MRVLIQNMVREPEKGRVRMTVQFGDEPPKQFLGDFDDSRANFTFSNIEEDLFFRLSDLAVKKYCNCTIYHIELGEIIGAFVSGQRMPPFPIELGTTDFGTTRPSAFKILFDRLTLPLRRPLDKVWCWWKFRHIIRANKRKSEKGRVGEQKPENR